MNRTSHDNEWPNLLVDCVIGSCAGLIAGVLLPIGHLWKAFSAFELGPGQSGTVGGIFGLLCGCGVFFFSKSAAVGYEKTSSGTYAQNGFAGGRTPEIIISILILTIVVQVMLVKSWT